MADVAGIVEAQELRFMQAWLNRDAGTFRKLSARSFMMMIGTNPPELLDRPSFAAAMEAGFRCSGFRLGAGVVRRYGRCATYTSGAELQLQLGDMVWSGPFLKSGL